MENLRNLNHSHRLYVWYRYIKSNHIWIKSYYYILKLSRVKCKSLQGYAIFGALKIALSFYIIFNHENQSINHVSSLRGNRNVNNENIYKNTIMLF